MEEGKKVAREVVGLAPCRPNSDGACPEKEKSRCVGCGVSRLRHCPGNWGWKYGWN
jgi:hypothetical protein